MTTTQTGNVQAIQPFADLDKLAEIFVAAFPGLDAGGRRLAMTLYRLLSEGRAVSCERLAQALDTPTAAVSQTLSQWPAVFYDESDHIIGFLGLTVEQTRHCLRVNEATVYAWCAWDTLFLPELLGTTATVTSTCAASGAPIRLTVSPTRIETAEPADTVVSFLVPEKEELRRNVTTSFCRFVHYFRSRKDGQTWVDEHDGTFLLSLEDAFVVGKKKNALRFGHALGTKAQKR
jgi:alkylmercury lyase